MTTKLEKQFFDTFGIEPKKIYLCPHCKTKLSGCTWVGDEQRFECLYSWGEHPYYMGKEVEEKAIIDYEYPQITDKHYLELICISNKELIKRFDIRGSGLESLKSNILSKCIKDYTFYSNTLCKTCNRLAESFKHQVQQLFKE